jgi:hypothetical protein
MLKNNIQARKEINETLYIRMLNGSIHQLRKIVLLLFFTTLCITANSQTGELNIGTATTDITPALPVALDGQMHLRIARTADTPLMASVIVLESHQGNRSIESVVFVSCELVTIPLELLAEVRKEVHQRLPELDVNKIIMNATHTHTGPVVRVGIYPIPEKNITQEKLTMFSLPGV